MISRFSKAWRSVQFSGQAWISRNPGGEEEGLRHMMLEGSLFCRMHVLGIMVYGQCFLWSLPLRMAVYILTHVPVIFKNTIEILPPSWNFESLTAPLSTPRPISTLQAEDLPWLWCPSRLSDYTLGSFSDCLQVAAYLGLILNTFFI